MFNQLRLKILCLILLASLITLGLTYRLTSHQTNSLPHHLVQLVLTFSNPLTSDQLLSLVSQYRVTNRLSALTQNSSLCQFSQDRLNEIISKNDWSHNGFWPLLYTDPPNSNSDYELHFPWMGENLAYGYNSSQAVLTAWIHSPEHLANLVNPHYTQACVAVQSWPAKNGWLVVMNYGSDDAYATQSAALNTSR